MNHYTNIYVSRKGVKTRKQKKRDEIYNTIKLNN